MATVLVLATALVMATDPVLCIWLRMSFAAIATFRNSWVTTWLVGKVITTSIVVQVWL